MTTSPIASIGFVGLGVMGGPQCANLVRKSGLPVAVFDTDAAKVATLVDAGARAASSLVDLAATADAIVMSLPGGPQVEAVVTELLPHLRAGHLVIDLSTTPVAVSQRLAGLVAERGASFIDAPVARTRQAAIDGTLAIMVGGSDADLERARPLLECLATDITHCGAVGAGSMVKVLNNMVVFETVVALSEAITVARASGLVEPTVLFDAFAAGSAASFALAHHGMKSVLPDEHPEGVFSSAYMLKDLGYAIEAGADAGVELPSASLAASLLSRAVDAGYRDAYHTAVVRIIEQGSIEGGS